MSKQTSTVHAPKVGRGLAICLRDVVSEFADGQRVSTGKASVVTRGNHSTQNLEGM